MALLRTIEALVVLVPVLGALPQDHPHRASPFEDVRWNVGRPEVEVGGIWYRPIAIDGLEVDDIVAECDRRWPGAVEKRFREDLMEAMWLLGNEPGESVTLDLLRLSDGASIVLPDVPNTFEKRQHLLSAGVRSVLGPTRASATMLRLTREEALLDVDAFEHGLRTRFAYLGLQPTDWEGELARLRAELGDSVRIGMLARDLERILLRFGDGHASVQGAPEPPGSRGPFLPFLLADAAGGVVALTPERDAFLDDDRPFVVALDGRSLEECLEALRDQVTAGSPQLVRRRSLRLLQDLSTWREDADAPSLEVRLASSTGDEVTRAVDPAAERASLRDWPFGGSRMLEDGVGYLRIASMSDRAAEEVHRRMRSFRETRGLVVDVRGNGGGSREALLALAGYLTDPEVGPWIGNVAAYRLAEGFDADHLAARFMYADHADWTDAQRAAVQAVRETFEPEWELPPGFSEWHYLVLDRTGHPGEFHYGRPVVVLSDAACFSATDIFLGALELLPDVTLVGSPSSGGSARSQSFTLPGSGLVVKCASMASFRPDGRLYDGRGVEVDVEVLPEPEDFLVGGGDAVLEAALELLRRD